MTYQTTEPALVMMDELIDYRLLISLFVGGIAAHTTGSLISSICLFIVLSCLIYFNVNKKKIIKQMEQ
jgi:hypothetical protein